MDFERLEQAWRSEANRPSEAQQAKLTEELMTTLKTRRRTEFLLAAIPFTAMTVFTVIAGASVLRGGEDFRDWAGMAMLGVCWVVMIAVFWNGFRARTRDTGQPMRDTLAGLLARNQAARRNYMTFCALTPVFLFPLWMGFDHLKDDGRMSASQGFQAMALCVGALVASYGWNTLRFYWVMKPEQRRLEGLLQQYEP
jgi:hypothetical protein